MSAEFPVFIVVHHLCGVVRDTAFTSTSDMDGYLTFQPMNMMARA